jgi:Domain of unknown function (DUF4304)
MTAQEAFTTMVKEQIAPSLRELGFKGSGQRFTLPDEKLWAQIGLQKFSWSDPDAVEFTANVPVVRRDVWEQERLRSPHLPKQPAPNIFYGTYAWQTRIGNLLPERDEKRWRVEPDRPTEPVAEEFVAAIREYALPAMRKRMR